jgi:hypothetical protein
MSPPATCMQVWSEDSDDETLLQPEPEKMAEELLLPKLQGKS